MFAGSEKSAFIIVEGDAEFRKDGDEVIVIHDPHGEDEVTVTTRDGWEFSDGTTSKQFSHKVGTTNEFDLVGRDGENWTRVEVRDDHAHHQTEEEDLVSSPIAEAASAPDEAVYLYAAPLVGVLCPTNSASWRIATNGMHQITLTTDKCNVPGCNQSGRSVTNDMPIVITVDQLEKTFTVVPSPVDGRLISGQYTFNYFARWANTNCIEQLCETFAATNSSVNVFKMSVTNDLYIGLDMTDIGKTTNMVRNAWVEFQPEPSLGKYDLAYEWKTAGLCRIVPETAGNRAARFKNISSDTASVNYRDQELECSVTIASKENAAWSSATGTNQFTVVKVDVEIEMKEDKYTKKGENELAEEKRGAYLYHIPDATNGLWTVEATNELRKVEFKFEPSNLPEDQTVTIEADENLLYELKDGKYNPARKNYTLKDLKKRKFVLHGHRRSEKYLGDEIRFIHDLSGAIDVAKCTVFGRPLIVADYNRDGDIDDKYDKPLAEERSKTFRHWINDDGDSKGSLDINEKYNIPGEGDDYDKDRVNGRCDLLDFAPLWIDLSSVYPAGSPQEIIDKTVWSIKSSCMAVLWTGMTKETVGKFHDNDVSGCGDNLKEVAYKAKVAKADSATGVNFPEAFRKKLLHDDSCGVVFVEGTKEGDDFQVIGTLGEFFLSVGDIKCKISSVTDMYRWLNIRHCADDEDESKVSNLTNPKNNPDEENDERHYVFVHGYNVGASSAECFAAEMFKRLWQSGLRSRFTAVDWYGNETQIFNSLTPNYYQNVYNAFKTSKMLAEKSKFLKGRKIFMAHSLGAVLTSSAIQDYSMECSRLYLLNGAVAVQAYNESAYTNEMLESSWKYMDKSKTASEWYTLFDKEDFRSSLNWKGRFAGVQGMVNCYSPTEEVVGNKGLFQAWIAQEKGKGTKLSNFFKLELSLQDAGWGRRTRYRINPRYYAPFHGFFGAAFKYLTREEMITRPPFRDFNFRTAEMHSLDAFIIDKNTDKERFDVLRGHFLGDAIPATSFGAGGNSVPGVPNINYESCKTAPEKWPAERKGEWHHSDMKNIAYFHVKKLFDKLVKEEEE